MPTSSRNSKSNQWTDEEKEILKLGVLSGKLLKTIANEIGRTETAVCKFLNRSNMRRKRPEPQRYFQKQKKQKAFEVSRSALKKVYINELESDLSEVVDYLVSIGHKVHKSPEQHKMFNIEGDYVLNGKPISNAKLLLFANRLRTEERKPIFTVQSLIW